MKNIITLFISFLFCTQLIYSAEYTYNPSQMATLKSKLDGGLVAGDIVYLADGTYPDFQVKFKAQGTESKPITLKALNPGQVVLTGKINLKISGTYLLVDGLLLKDGQALDTDIIEFRTSSSDFAYNCRLTNTVIDNCNNPSEDYTTSTDLSERWIMLYGKNNRVDHCYFTNKINGGVLMMVNISDAKSQENKHLIDSNFFSTRPRFAPGNNAEIIRLGDSFTSQLSCQSIIQNNFFYACDGEVEIISIKSCDNIIENNTFYESEGAVVCRHGNRNTIRSNAFIGNKKADCGGVRIINQGHKVYNNYFQDLVGTASRSALCVMMGVFELPTASTNFDKEPLNAYNRVKDVEISYNTFVNCANIDLGTATTYTYSSSNPVYPGKKVSGTLIPECTIARNVIYNPTQSSALNIVSGNTSDIKYSNNLYKFSKTSTVSGFVSRPLSYTKTVGEYGKGIYVLDSQDAQVLSADKSTIHDFTYVTSDIAATQRPVNKSMGAQQYESVKRPFVVAKPSVCAIEWYPLLQSEILTVNKKIDLWETIPNSIINETTNSTPVRLQKEGYKLYKISSDTLLDEVRISDSIGKLISQHIVRDYSMSLDCQHLLSGLYLFTIRTAEGNSLSKKVLI